jgi:hypothetical protein
MLYKKNASIHRFQKVRETIIYNKLMIRNCNSKFLVKNFSHIFFKNFFSINV